MESLTDLSQAMVDKGYPAISDLRANSEYHRFAIDGHNGQPGYYIIHQSASGISAAYGDFVSGKKYRWTSGNNGKDLSPEERQALNEQLAKEAAELGEKIRRKHEKGAMAANFFWSSGEEITAHEYLKSKNVKSHGLRRCTIGSYAGWLMVPGYNADGQLVTVQYINRDGQKRFETGGQKKGAYFEIPGNGGKVDIAEGYSTGASVHEATDHTVIIAFDAGNLVHVAKVIREKHPDADIIIAADNDAWKPETGNTGLEAAKAAAIEINAKIAMPSFKDKETATKPTDFNDLANLEGLEAVRAQIEAAAEIDKIEALKAEIQKIIDLDPLEQEIHRAQLAKKYDVRKSAIDQYICQQSKTECDYQKVVEDVAPATDPVDGAKMLDGMLADIKRRIILPEGAAVAIALWILLTYCHKAFNVLPLLGVVSPTKRCGKTTLIEILQALTCKGLTASSLTPAAVFRTIEKYSPTLLIDEADTFLKDYDELRGILNSGHTRASAFVIRVEGEKHEPVKFSTWGPKAIGMIGDLPVTLKDRSIVIRLSRKMPGEKIIKTGLDFSESCISTRSKCRRWAIDNLAKLKSISVSFPPSGNDRADDNWYPLFCIAHTIGGDWPDKVKESMQQLLNVSDYEVIGIKLLSDIRDIFNEQSVERMFSKDIVERLKELSDSPWADWSRAKGLSTNGLANLLKPFGVSSKTMRIDGELAKGYTLESFQDAFNRYIPPDSNVTPLQANDINKLCENQDVTQDIGVTDENTDNQLNLFSCYGVTDKKEVDRGIKEIDAEKSKKWETGTI